MSFELESYLEFTRTTDPILQRRSSGWEPFEIERELLAKYQPQRLLDLGCSDGERMFSLYEDMKIDFLGVEQDSNLAGMNKKRIVNLDFSSGTFLRDLSIILNQREVSPDFDMVALFESIWGIFPEIENIAWSNISHLVQPGKILLFNTFVSFP